MAGYLSWLECDANNAKFMGSIPILAIMYILSVKITSHMHVNCQGCHRIMLSELPE